MRLYAQNSALRLRQLAADVGLLVGGFPRETAGEVKVAGVRTNFRMPDVLSIGIGGGSIVDVDTAEVGPESVGYRLTSEALVFGGSTLTATDIAVAAGRAQIGDARDGYAWAAARVEYTTATHGALPHDFTVDDRAFDAAGRPLAIDRTSR